MSSSVKQIKLGIVGAAGRGGSFRKSLDALPQYRLHALCDLNPEGLAKAAETLGAEHTYTNYE